MRILFTLALLVTLLGCSHEQPVSHQRAYTYTAKLVNGQVYLSLNGSPDQRVGPFIKKSDTEYICEAKNQGVHYLTRSSSGDWFYSWSYVQMRDEPVHGGVLLK